MSRERAAHLASRTDASVSVPAQILRVAARVPQQLALVERARAWTYAELAQSAARLARKLGANAVGKGDVVAICAPPGASMVIAQLGSWLAGAAFLPLDPSYPRARLEIMLEDSQAAVLIDGAELGLSCERTWSLEQALSEREVGSDEPCLAKDLHGEDLAYLLYTSGSTGKPKGVLVEHAALLNYVAWDVAYFGLCASDRVSQIIAPSFDMSVWEIWPTLVAGASLHFAERSDYTRPHALWRWLAEERVTVTILPTPLAEVLLKDAAVPACSLRSMLVAGERLRSFAGQGRSFSLFNLYGPTETTMNVTCARVPPKGSSPASLPSIGSAVAGAILLVLDGEGAEVPRGEAGELYVGGPGLARGYLARPELTRERFVVRGDQRLYRTGDLVREADSGELEFIGRIDQQVKLRGHRIELGEIEAVLMSDARVGAAAVMLCDDVLCAWLVPREPGGAMPVDALRAHVALHLPSYMVPGRWQRCSSLPKTPNGKVDRAALTTRLLAEQRSSHGDDDLLCPQLARMWSEALGGVSVGPDSSFFELGGHSLSALSLVAAIERELAIPAGLADLTEAGSFAAFCRRLALRPRGEPAAAAKLAASACDASAGFALTDVQHAYWVGRQGVFELGDVATHLYFEREGVLDVTRLERALRSVIQHHPMLRAVVDADGKQKVLTSVHAYEIRHYDLSGLSPEACERHLTAVRDELSHQVLDTRHWPLFDVRASTLPSGETRLHLSFDALIVDAQSLFRLLDEWHRLYVDPERTLLPARSAFVDYIAALESSKQTPAFEIARRYWRERVASLPEAPELPLAVSTRVERPTHFVRRTVRLGKVQWAGFRRRAHEAEVTETVALLSAYADVLAAFSKSPHFLLNLTLFDRRALVEDVESIVGDFTSISLLEIDARGDATFGERAAGVQRRLFQDLDHRAYGGVQVLRDCARVRGRVGAPVVFTSQLGFDGLGRDTAVLERFGRETYAITQTPQVWIDLQVLEVGGELVAYWDSVEDLFLPGVMDAMCAALVRKLGALADGPDAWSSQSWLARDSAAAGLPLAEPPVDSARSLHARFVEQAQRSPARIAIVQGAYRVSYGELLVQAQRIATALREHVEPGTLVGVALAKSPGQIAAVLGVLLAGAAYVPLDPSWPGDRTARLLAQAKVEVVITSQTASAIPPEVCSLRVEAMLASSPSASASARAEAAVTLPSQLAYVIFTSGSTGTPKGVMISHEAAWNTIADVLQRMELRADDAVFGISSLSFDLSVFDIFGSLSVGAKLVLPASDQQRDPLHWLSCLQREKVTLWSSVPALVELLASAVTPSTQQTLESLRVVMMSGDWIAPSLPGRLRALGVAAKLFSLGGATEGSIWSIVHPIDEVDASWASIPYGRAMAGQQVEVLDAQHARRPAWVTGEIYLGGLGVALGYLGEEARTARAFVLDAQTGQRWYRTGDLGRLHPDGTIELLGREDGQVKINGYRVELGELEAALNCHPDVQASAVLALGERGRRRLGAVFVPRSADLTADQVRAHLAARVPEYMLPTQLLSLTSLPLTANGKLDRAALEKLLATESNMTLEPVSGLEAAVRDLWAEVLERPADTIGALSNFFDAGGDSLSAIKLRSRLGQLFLRTELPITFVFEHATVRAQTRIFSDPVVDAESPGGAAARRGQLRRAASLATAPPNTDAGRARR